MVDVDVKINMSIEEYENFLEKYFPEMYKTYSFMVDKMSNDYFYDEKMIKSYLLEGIVPLINKHLVELKGSTEESK